MFRSGCLAVYLAMSAVTGASAEEYGGQAPSAAWRDAAAQRIDEHRKADIAFRIVDAGPTHSVVVRMVEHAFDFVAADHPPTLGGTSNPANVAKRELTTSGLFNGFKGNTVKTTSWAGDIATWNTAVVQDVILDSGLKVHGNHVMYLRESMFAGLQDLDLYDAVADKWTEILDTQLSGGQTIGQVAHTWNILNEAYNRSDRIYEHLSSSNNEAQRRGRLIGFINNRADAWRNSGRIRSDAKFIINEARILSQRNMANNEASRGNREDWFYGLLQDLLDPNVVAEAKFDAIGFQSHHGEVMTDMDDVWNILERFDQLGKEMIITEYDIKITGDSSKYNSWSTQDVMALEAEYTRDFMTMVFSHPGVSGFHVWQLYDGNHWKDHAVFLADGVGDGGLQNLQMKPAGQAFIDLVLGEWWTDEEVLVDADGQVSLRGFLGRYEIIIGSGADAVVLDAVLTREGLFTLDGEPIVALTAQGVLIPEPTMAALLLAASGMMMSRRPRRFAAGCWSVRVRPMFT